MRPNDRPDEPESLPNMTVTSTLVESKQWLVVPLPSTYSSTNWPIRVSLIVIL